MNTKYLKLQPGALNDLSEVFISLYGSESALIIADENTFAAAGGGIYNTLKRAGIKCAEPYIFPSGIYAEYSLVEEVHKYIDKNDGIPIAVGSGTINDLVKLASHQSNRPYIVVATAASMDGYTAYGASITHKGSKQTFDCPAPQAVIADLDVLMDAPEEMNASGYGDLFAKCPAGADWILADGCGVESINNNVWEMVQRDLSKWLDNPSGIRERNPESISNLARGLMMTGFAMQTAKSSRPASGAEHQFSHLWDMQNHKHGSPPSSPSHGFKVAIGSLASIALYERLFESGIESLNIDDAVAKWPDRKFISNEIDELFDVPELRVKAHEESIAKYIERDTLAKQLDVLKCNWKNIRKRLRDRLYKYNEAVEMLRAAGCPIKSEQIGISSERLKLSYKQAYHIRRRFTVLDLARRIGIEI